MHPPWRFEHPKYRRLLFGLHLRSLFVIMVNALFVFALTFVMLDGAVPALMILLAYAVFVLSVTFAPLPKGDPGQMLECMEVTTHTMPRLALLWEELCRRYDIIPAPSYFIINDSPVVAVWITHLYEKRPSLWISSGAVVAFEDTLDIILLHELGHVRVVSMFEHTVTAVASLPLSVALRTVSFVRLRIEQGRFSFLAFPVYWFERVLHFGTYNFYAHQEEHVADAFALAESGDKDACILALETTNEEFDNDSLLYRRNAHLFAHPSTQSRLRSLEWLSTP